ncbi:MAG TPA: PA14 domain-containing protein, partial [Candidatus Sulfotelmatobacter sp.]|nr:PA14 domain-containing protein [Candidatus Sulfotelmatobacter sp.]
QIFMFPNPFRAALWNMWFKEGADLPPLGKKLDYVVMLADGQDAEERLILDYLRRSPYYKTVRHNGEILVLKNVRRHGKSGFGANYILSDPGGQVRQTGKLSMLYFPDSGYYFRNLLGEELPGQRPFALEIFGYLFLPADGHYIFSVAGGDGYLLTLNGRPVPDHLKRGFYKFRLKYLRRAGPGGLKFVVTPPSGRSYIIPDEQLLPGKDPALFARVSRRTPATRPVRPTNLLRNSGFEKTFAAAPRDWRVECWQGENAACSSGVSATAKKSGRYSAMLKNDGLADSRWVQELAVKPNTIYQLSGWVRTENVGSQGAGAFLLTEGAPLRTAQLFGTTGWRFLAARGRTGYGVTRLKVLCRLGDYGATNSGVAYFDGLEFSEVPDDD